MKKQKQLKVKLQLNKITIAKLNEHQMIALKGGNYNAIKATFARGGIDDPGCTSDILSRLCADTQ